ncbi:helix-turn-helix domain-containing protein [Apibacter sp. HY039]|uniref:helix-turn-helix domain-containing protein n=1 Tax=Apibacter sp. HY039 TaxID=2501476 RepID=UPI000FEBDB47|nr:helix-turn-helix transcriptional regulator [Apibacter sp. HY039]
MDISKRITYLINILGLSPGEFADKINVQRSGISHITSGRNKPSLDFLERTLKVFPEVNSDWLILGKGSPVKNRDTEIFSSLNTDEELKESKKSPSVLFEDNDTVHNPDLFSQTIIPSSTFNISKEKKEISPDENVREDSKEINKEDKKIKKIIILYSDHSFEVYDN